MTGVAKKEKSLWEYLRKVTFQLRRIDKTIVMYNVIWGNKGPTSLFRTRDYVRDS